MAKYTPTPQEFDDWADTLDEDIRLGAGSFPFLGYEQVLDEVARQAQVVPGSSVLDLGVGTGKLAERFLALGCRVYGLDFSPRMLDVARARFPQLYLAQADLIGDWSSVIQRSFDRTRFDRIVSGYTFHHFELPLKLRLLTRLAADFLTPGGCIVIGDITFESAADQEAACQHWADLWEEEDYWIAGETLAACQQAGLQVNFQPISPCAGVFAIQPASGFHVNKEPS